MIKLNLLRTIILLSLWVSCSLYANAQAIYSLSVENKPYIEISGGTLITNTFTNNVYVVSLPYQQLLFNQNPGTQWQVGKNGFIVAVGPQFAFALDPLVASLSKKDNSTSIESKIEQAGNDTVLIIQWKNMKLDSGAANDFINIQCRVYKNSQTVELHYGPSNVATADSAMLTSQVGIFWLTKDFSQAYEYNNLKGTSTAPLLDRNPQNPGSLNGVPANGTVFRFSKNNATGISKINKYNREVYPNPVEGTLYFSDKSFKSPLSYCVYDAMGRQILKGVVDEATPSIALITLEAGVYTITLNGEEGITTHKIIKK